MGSHRQLIIFKNHAKILDALEYWNYVIIKDYKITSYKTMDIGYSNEYRKYMVNYIYNGIILKADKDIRICVYDKQIDTSCNSTLLDLYEVDKPILRAGRKTRITIKDELEGKVMFELRNNSLFIKRNVIFEIRVYTKKEIAKLQFFIL